MKNKLPVHNSFHMIVNEDNRRGYPYCSGTLNFTNSQPYQVSRNFILNEQESVTQWYVQYLLSSNDDYDDNIDDTSIHNVIIEADNFSAAVKYAQQYARKQSHEDHLWARAEIISIVQK